MKWLWLLLLPLTLVASPAREASRALLSHLALKGHERVLDLGCGDGSLTAEIAGQVPEGFVLGLDREAAMIRFAEQAYDPELIANLQFQRGDALSLEYQEKFDVACLLDSLQWIEHQQGALARVAKGLKQGGRLCLVVPLESELDRTVAQVMEDKRWRKAVAEMERPRLTPADKVVELVREAGLAPIHVETEGNPVCFPSQGELASWLADHLPEALAIAGDQRIVFLKEVTEAYLKRCGERLCVERPTLSLVAVKR
ncbi:MAG: trans-aconitate 2-methyltransferase [Parachlamydiales bacterium]